MYRLPDSTCRPGSRAGCRPEAA